MIELTVRLVFSLSVVLGLLFLCARVAGRRFQGRRDALVQVVHRQALGRHAAVSVVNVGGRVLVLGTTDQEVRLLTELDPADIAEDDTDDGVLSLVADGDEHLGTYDDDLDLDSDQDSVLDAGPVIVPAAFLAGRTARPRIPQESRTRPVPATASRAGGGGVAGSVLSVRTWRQAWDAVTGQAS